MPPPKSGKEGAWPVLPLPKGWLIGSLTLLAIGKSERCAGARESWGEEVPGGIRGRDAPTGAVPPIKGSLVGGRSGTAPWCFVKWAVCWSPFSV